MKAGIAVIVALCIAVLIVLAGATPAFAQGEKPKFRGIATYRIGESRLEPFLHSLDSLGVIPPKVRSTTALQEEQLKAGGFIVAEIEHDKNAPMVCSSPSPRVRVFYITKLVIGTLVLPEFYVSYHDGVLYRIWFTMNKDVYEAVREKYGMGSMKESKTMTDCTKDGRKRSYETTAITEAWVSEGVIAMHIIAEFYSGTCTKEIVSAMEISSVPVSAMVDEEESRVRDHDADAAKQKRQEELKGL